MFERDIFFLKKKKCPAAAAAASFGAAVFALLCKPTKKRRRRKKKSVVWSEHIASDRLQHTHREGRKKKQVFMVCVQKGQKMCPLFPARAYKCAAAGQPE